MEITKSNKNQIKFKNKIYQLNLAFPLVFECFQILKDKKLNTLERLELALFCFIEDSLEDLSIKEKNDLLTQIFDQFIYTEEDKRRAELTKHQPQAFDYEQDSDLIYSAVLQQYNIDLTKPNVQRSLSWSQFNALINGLTDETFFRKVTMYRTIKIDKEKMPEEQQNFLKEMKLLYGLHKSKPNEQLTADELAMILAPLDQPHKFLKIKELQDQGRLPKPGTKKGGN
ncbi:MAG: Gp15 family bacteriophage protein [Lactobacillaceae bacterium]